MYFASDNSAPVHPKVMQALVDANENYTMPYGNDPTMDDVRARIRDIFEAPEAEVRLVATGTAANVLALALYSAPWSAIYCHPEAHINVDECGAPEFYTSGAKLMLVAGDHARMTPDTLEQAISATSEGDPHCVQRGMLSLTNVTEVGTVYTAAETAALTAIARRYGLPVHLDGARFANAVAATGASPADMSWRAGIDVLSLGGTKNGLMGVEAVVIFDPAKAWELELRRKRGGHLFSKHRYLAAQMQAYLKDGLWLELAETANRRMARLADGMAALPDVQIMHPVEANMIYAEWPCRTHRAAVDAGAVYTNHSKTTDRTTDGTMQLARLVCSWSTTDADVDRFLELLKG